MFKGEDEDDDDGNSSVARYPCMPSLVALQQMRNRLHLAYVGKKLMKWTAMATGRELRKVAWDIIGAYKTFREDLANAYMLLARARYFQPNMTQMALENLGHDAPVTVDVNFKSVSGVKVPQVDLIDSNIDAYAHLGIERGGHAITEAKHAWRDLLKRIILMLQYRVGFSELDMANKSANKRKVVLTKIVIPRTVATIRYILAQMEELQRENYYRMKLIIAMKERKKKCKHEDSTTCPICLRTKLLREQGQERCYVCGCLLNVDGVSSELYKESNIEDEGKIEEFKLHLDEIVDITKSIDKRCVESSMNDFIKSAQYIKEKLEEPVKKAFRKLEPIPLNVPLENLCKMCKARLRKEKAERAFRKKAAEQITEEEVPKEEEIQESKITVKSVNTFEPLCQQHAILEDLELGVFEIETEEITKIVRVRNDDGIVREQKKVIRLKKEKRTPLPPDQIPPKPVIPCVCSDPLPIEKSESELILEVDGDVVSESSSLPSCPACKSDHCGPKTIGIVTIKDSILKNNIWKTRSEMWPPSERMGEPKARSCLSLVSIITYLSSLTLFGSYDEKSIIIEKIDKNEGLSKLSSSEFEEMLKLHEPCNNYAIGETSAKDIYSSSDNNSSLHSKTGSLETLTSDSQLTINSKLDGEINKTK